MTALTPRRPAAFVANMSPHKPVIFMQSPKPRTRGVSCSIWDSYFRVSGTGIMNGGPFLWELIFCACGICCFGLGGLSMGIVVRFCASALPHFRARAVIVCFRAFAFPLPAGVCFCFCVSASLLFCFAASLLVRCSALTLCSRAFPLCIVCFLLVLAYALAFLHPNPCNSSATIISIILIVTIAVFIEVKPISISTYTYIYIYIYMCVCVCACLRIYVRLSICTYVYTLSQCGCNGRLQHVSVYIHIYICTYVTYA